MCPKVVNMFTNAVALARRHSQYVIQGGLAILVAAKVTGALRNLERVLFFALEQCPSVEFCRSTSRFVVSGRVQVSLSIAVGFTY